MENEIIIHSENDLRSKIYTIRGMRVMLDFDLAEIYGYSVKAFNRQVKNNIEKFDEDFRFQITKEEYYEILRCKNCTLESSETIPLNPILRSKISTLEFSEAIEDSGSTLTLEQGKYSKYLPYAFTEQGIYMLMTVLRGDLAVKQSKILIRLFKTMKDFIIERENLIGSDEVARLAIQTSQNTKDIARIDQKLSDISRKIHNFTPIEIPKNLLYLDETTVEADKNQPQINIESKILVIRSRQVMIDRDLAELYGVETKRLNEQVRRNIERFPKDFCFQLNDDETKELVAFCDRFASLKHSSVNPYAFTEQGIAMLSSVLRSPNAVEVNIQIMRAFFNEQYPTLELKHTDKIHDRFLIIDRKILYHIGASLKDLGKKCFAFEILDSLWIAEILRNL